ncbi:hypothetical protein Taro_027774 [Colocasia esculenta]|uniref:Uncharacterized protein n=1 Tax=Colocasia esculenta TaxID=4460 RepID=A0A843VVA2_COLES|nr:hypothetical protein [Colocasia esculenta]
MKLAATCLPLTAWPWEVGVQIDGCQPLVGGTRQDIGGHCGVAKILAHLSIVGVFSPIAACSHPTWVGIIVPGGSGSLQRCASRHQRARSCRDASARRDGIVIGRSDTILSRRGCCPDALPHRDGIATALEDTTVPVLPRVFPWFRLWCRRVPQGRFALRTFRWGTQQVASLRSVTDADTFVAVSWRRCQEGRVCLIID